MRNIKFRGKSKISNEWVYGDLSKMWNGIPFIMPKCYFATKDLGQEDIEEIKNNTELAFGGFIEVIPDTVCQLVAIRNGIEFYEHDILEDFLSIRWNDEDSAFEFYWTYSGKNTEGDFNWYENDTILKEVVGNIFDNPEMVDNAVS